MFRRLAVFAGTFGLDSAEWMVGAGCGVLADDPTPSAQRPTASPPRHPGVASRSAGGNLSTVVCLRALDEGAPLPVHQLLVYPVATFAPEGEAATSIAQYGEAQPMLAGLLQRFGDFDQADPANPSESPLLAADLSGLPPATIIGAPSDVLQSQEQVYAAALVAVGNDGSYTLYEGMPHKFFGLGKAQQAV